MTEAATTPPTTTEVTEAPTTPPTTATTEPPETTTTALSYANCEEALELDDTCGERAERAFQRWGRRLPRLLGDPDLGVYNSDDFGLGEVNAAALYACQKAAERLDEFDWLDDQMSIYPDLAPQAHEKIFDASMIYVCPNVNYSRQNEWEGYLPDGAVAVISGSEGDLEYSCVDIAYVQYEIEEDLCAEGFQGQFDMWVGANPTGFNDFVSGAVDLLPPGEFKVVELAAVGWDACITVLTDETFDSFLETWQPRFPSADPPVFLRLFDLAQQTVCA